MKQLSIPATLPPAQPWGLTVQASDIPCGACDATFNYLTVELILQQQVGAFLGHHQGDDNRELMKLGNVDRGGDWEAKVDSKKEEWSPGSNAVKGS